MKKKKKIAKITPKKDLEVIEKITGSSGFNEFEKTNELISEAIKTKVSVETMEKVLAMRRELKAEWAKEQFDVAMSNFQMDCPIIEKKKIVYEKNKKDIRYKYASLESIVDQAKSFISENGLSYSLNVLTKDNMLKVICIVKHISGHSENSEFTVPIGSENYMSDVQKYGARATFAKRYAFCNAFGILTGDEDTDGVDNSPEAVPVQEATEIKTVTRMADETQIALLGRILDDISWNEESLIKKGIKPISEMSYNYADGIIKQLSAIREKLQKSI